ncbi:hypothetical protein GCM10027396_27680 [Insolitispirillum peregrinum]
MIAFALKLVEPRFMAPEEEKIRCLINDAQSPAAFIRKTLNPFNGRASAFYELDHIGDGSAFAVVGCVVIKPHTI